MQTQSFIVYRKTKTFMESLNTNDANLELHRQSTSGDARATNAIVSLLDSKALLPVAKVTCSPDNDQLFRLTNSIDDFWGNNPEVKLLPEAQRGFMSSSSVGDIYQDEAGQYFVYECSGVTAIEVLNVRD